MKANKLTIILLFVMCLPFVSATTETAIQQGGLVFGVGFFAFLTFYVAFNLSEKAHFILRYYF